MKVVYPAIFTPEEAGYSVRFPDLENCFTSGETLAGALEQAQDVLCLTLWDLEEDRKPINPPSSPADVAVEKGEFVSLVAADTEEYRRRMDSRAVKKTLTIPGWLNVRAEEAGVNFSQTLQSALMRELHIAE